MSKKLFAFQVVSKENQANQATDKWVAREGGATADGGGCSSFRWPGNLRYKGRYGDQGAYC